MNESMSELSRGALRRIVNFEQVDKPVVQLTDLQEGQSMFVLELFDGDLSFDNCVVHSPQLIQRLRSGEFPKSSLVVLSDYHFHKSLHFFYVKDMTLFNDINQRTDAQPNSDPTINANKTDEPTEQPLNPQNNVITEVERVREKENVSILESHNLKRDSQSLSTIPKTIENRETVPTNVCPINKITTYLAKWVIRGRVTSKGKKRRWQNQNGSGCLFSFVISDQSGDIRVNAFNPMCEKYFGYIEEDKVYRISGGSVKMSDKRFSNLSHDYEINLTSDSRVVECPPEEALSVNSCKPRYQFVPIKDLAQKPFGSVVDVIGAVKQIGDCYGSTTKRRDINLIDSTDTDINLTLWKEMAEQFDCQINAIIAVKSVVLKEFGGRSLTSYPNTDIKIEPDIPEAIPIKEWLSRREHNMNNLTNTTLPTEPSLQTNTTERSLQTNTTEPSLQTNTTEPSLQTNTTEPSLQTNPTEPSDEPNQCQPSDRTDSTEG